MSTAAPGNLAVKRHGILHHGNDCLAVSLNGSYAVYVARTAGLVKAGSVIA